MDPLSDVLRLLQPKSYSVGATDVGGDIAIRFPAYDGAYLYSVARGDCWLQVDGEAPMLLTAGDCVLLPSGRAFTLASDLDLPPTASSVLFDGRINGSIASYNGGGGCMMFAAYFAFDRHASPFLLDVLPCVLRVGDNDARTALRHAIEQMIEELQQARPGCEVIVEHLAHIAMTKVLRYHLSEVARERPGWLFALADPTMRKAIAAMHRCPSRRWTVASLADTAAMSRTTFATRFRAMVGMPPMDYLTRLRMLLAAQQLSLPGARVSTVGLALGYESESSFSAAFKRTMGCAPRRYAAQAPNTL